LHVGVGTVHSHVTNILSKLDASSRLQAQRHQGRGF
jgi:DNA-binding NarL/FixJ family response regulator